MSAALPATTTSTPKKRKADEMTTTQPQDELAPEAGSSAAPGTSNFGVKFNNNSVDLSNHPT